MIHRLTILPEEICVPVREGETILSAICRAGFTYRFGCRRGGCAVCKVRVLAGDVAYERPIDASLVSEQEGAGGIRLSCRAVPTSDVVIALQSDDHLTIVNPWVSKLEQSFQ
jgi:CDP-4-dehydro-6-deoxyglucose reductase